MIEEKWSSTVKIAFQNKDKCTIMFFYYLITLILQEKVENSYLNMMVTIIQTNRFEKCMLLTFLKILQ